MSLRGKAQFCSAKISVWWDLENCHVPMGCDPDNIAQNIRSALAKLNYCGPITFSACGDCTRIPDDVHSAPFYTGIDLKHVPDGFNYASNKILVDMLLWSVNNPAPANYLLISEEMNFPYALHQLRIRGYNILLAHPQPIKASSGLVDAATYLWNWTSLVYGGLPENYISDAIQTSRIAESTTKSPKSSNNTI
ncbi:hypothetical protein CASFOL_001736 [Castilleja foliolosa]|uniref:NYN domain-containing protein n=1 Tax=Castilleja foliolosa TaxID=1961234 RepID=A0ABD3ECE3_9LAMI